MTCTARADGRAPATKRRQGDPQVMSEGAEEVLAVSMRELNWLPAPRGQGNGPSPTPLRNALCGQRLNKYRGIEYHT